MGSFKCLQELSCQPGYELKDGECVGKTSVFPLRQLLLSGREGKGLQRILLLLVYDIRVELKKAELHGNVWLFKSVRCIHLFEAISNNSYK